MYDLFSIDEMACLFNLIKCSLQVIVPRVQSLISELLSLINGHNACQAINLCSNSAIDDHISQLVLSSLDGDSNELTHSCERNSAIVALNDTQVVLD